MGFYRRRIYPHLVSRLGDPPPIQPLRRELLFDARGEALEIGVGPGTNLLHYDPAKVRKPYALEPNATMVRLAERRATKRSWTSSSWAFPASASHWATPAST